MDIQLAQKAISAALNGNWPLAIDTNSEILKASPQDTDALNRLARAYAENGDLKKAKDIAKKTLLIDPFNSIASKCLEKWKNLDENYQFHNKRQIFSFLEEPGKTKIVSLLHLGNSKVLASLDAGDEVELHTQGHRISACLEDGKYIGRLADNLSTHLKNLIAHGNEYEVFIKSSSANEVKIFIRETKRSSSLKDIPSFTAERLDYVSFTPPELVHDRDELTESSDEYDSSGSD